MVRGEPFKDCSLVNEVRIEGGAIGDLQALACFRYRSLRTPARCKVFSLRRHGELCGVIVYTFSLPVSFGRTLVLQKCE